MITILIVQCFTVTPNLISDWVRATLWFSAGINYCRNSPSHLPSRWLWSLSTDHFWCGMDGLSVSLRIFSDQENRIKEVIWCLRTEWAISFTKLTQSLTCASALLGSPSRVGYCMDRLAMIRSRSRLQNMRNQKSHWSSIFRSWRDWMHLMKCVDVFSVPSSSPHSAMDSTLFICRQSVIERPSSFPDSS